MLPGGERRPDRTEIGLRGRRRAGPTRTDRARADLRLHRHACRSTPTCRRPDPEAHLTTGTREELAAFWLTLDAINFGSGWFPTLRKREGRSGYFTIAHGVRDRFADHGPWSADELAEIDSRRGRRHARPGPGPRADGAVRRLAERPRPARRRGPRRAVRGGRRLRRRARPSRSSRRCRLGVVRRHLDLRRSRGAVPQARADRHRRPLPRRRGGVPRPRSADDVRRQPRPPRPAPRRPARVTTPRCSSGSSAGADRARFPRGGRDPGVRASRGRADRLAARRRAAPPTSTPCSGTAAASRATRPRPDTARGARRTNGPSSATRTARGDGR